MYLGAIILIPFAVALVVRSLLEQRIVIDGPVMSSSKRQFVMDMAMSLTAGVVMVVYTTTVYGMPGETGAKMLIAYSAFGFFLALDMALARERDVIAAAVSGPVELSEPEHLFPVATKFVIFATAAAVVVTVILTLLIFSDQYWLASLDPAVFDLSEALMSVVYEVLFVMGVILVMVLNVIISYTRNMSMLFESQTRVLKRVRQGDLSGAVPVVTADEFGIIASHTNMMIRGLRHRARLLSALKVAEEVQQNLLPKEPPEIEGIDISGGSQYSNQVGGDYFDYFNLPDQRLGVLVADAAGHGVGAALFMSAARAFLKAAISSYEGPSQLLSHVNRLLTADSSDSGRFVSMFFLDVDIRHQVLRWVRAGHEPALFFDPGSGVLRPLSGDGTALGVFQNASLPEFQLTGWHPGALILVGTDGIRETENARREMFGLERLTAVVRNSAAKSADGVRKAILESLQAFRGGASQEDDVTMVVVKFL